MNKTAWLILLTAVLAVPTSAHAEAKSTPTVEGGVVQTKDGSAKGGFVNFGIKGYYDPETKRAPFIDLKMGGGRVDLTDKNARMVSKIGVTGWTKPTKHVQGFFDATLWDYAPKTMTGGISLGAQYGWKSGNVHASALPVGWIADREKGFLGLQATGLAAGVEQNIGQILTLAAGIEGSIVAGGHQGSNGMNKQLGYGTYVRGGASATLHLGEMFFIKAEASSERLGYSLATKASADSQNLSEEKSVRVDTVGKASVGLAF